MFKLYPWAMFDKAPNGPVVILKETTSFTLYSLISILSNLSKSDAVQNSLQRLRYINFNFRGLLKGISPEMDG